MKVTLILAPLLALALAAPAQAQTAQPASKILQVTPAMRAKVKSINKNVISATKLTTEQSKKSFIASQLQLDPAEIGLSPPMTL